MKRIALVIFWALALLVIVFINFPPHSDQLKMKTILLAALVVSLAGCKSGPKPGDVYENIWTRERIQVKKAGICKDLGKHDEPGRCITVHENIVEDKVYSVAEIQEDWVLVE